MFKPNIIVLISTKNNISLSFLFYEIFSYVNYEWRVPIKG